MGRPSGLVGGVKASPEALIRRQRRFGDNLASKPLIQHAGAATERKGMKKRGRNQVHVAGSKKARLIEIEEGVWIGDNPIVGTCTRIEKSYFRLTTAPDPAKIRPQRVLWQSLEYVKRRWAHDEDYEYAKDQLRSIRQDLMVQGLQNTFVVEVYETHARIAIEADDHEELRVCIDRLDHLRSEAGLSGHADEFLAYNLLLHLHTKGSGGVEAQRWIAEMRPDLRRSPAVAHAMRVWKARARGDYVSFFRLYQRAPNMSSYLMDEMAENLRERAISVIVGSYRLKYPLSKLMHILALPNPDFALPLLKARKVVVTSDPLALDIDQTRGISPQSQPNTADIQSSTKAIKEEDTKAQGKQVGEINRLRKAVESTESKPPNRDRLRRVKSLLKRCKILLGQPNVTETIVATVAGLRTRLRLLKKGEKDIGGGQVNKVSGKKKKAMKVMNKTKKKKKKPKGGKKEKAVHLSL
ncbi:hypothetical protein AAMO2058_000396000 [Amorphochlora amoebiformis]